MEQLSLYIYSLDAGRMGELEGMLIAPVGLPEQLVDWKLSVYWGEVLGKHSDIQDTLDQWSFSRRDISEQLIQLLILELKLDPLEDWPGVYTIMGYNPFTKLNPEVLVDE